MRPVNTQARALLDRELRVRGQANAIELAQALNVSVPSIHRIIRERGNDVIRIGTTKNARYALRRSLRGQAEPIPVYAIDTKGRGRALATMDIVAPQGSVLDVNLMGWPSSTTHQTWWDGMPYPLQDMRPQGFLGRGFARQIARDFGVSENPEDWSDDDIIYVLSLKGSDCPGNLIIGESAYRAYLYTLTQQIEYISEDELPARYAELANLATSYGVGGSSAGGEFPKFTAIRSLNQSLTTHVIVKFSGADHSTAVRRWADLLICEHLALETLRDYGQSASSSRIIVAQGRTFLEVERFDRVGDFGRIASISLASLDGAFVGLGSGSWVDVANRLVVERILNNELLAQVSLLEWFGRLIANTDMHFGNLTFLIEDAVKLSPAYDMLPMLYKPLAGGEVPARQFEVTLPMPDEQTNWNLACNMALSFWQRTAADHRISIGFREICQQNYEKLSMVADRLR